VALRGTFTGVPSEEASTKPFVYFPIGGTLITEERMGVVSATQGVSPSGIETQEAVSSGQITVVYAWTGIPSDEKLSPLTVLQLLGPSGIVSLEVSGTAGGTAAFPIFFYGTVIGSSSLTGELEVIPPPIPPFGAGFVRVVMQPAQPPPPDHTAVAVIAHPPSALGATVTVPGVVVVEEETGRVVVVPKGVPTGKIKL